MSYAVPLTVISEFKFEYVTRFIKLIMNRLCLPSTTTDTIEICYLPDYSSDMASSPLFKCVTQSHGPYYTKIG